jgi:hypothetical protein
LEDGVDSDYLSMAKSTSAYHKGVAYKLDKIPGAYSEDESLWHPFHFSHFNIPLPLRHPFYLTIPELRFKQSKQDVMGAKFLDQRQKVLGSFEVGEKIKFKLSFNKQKLFLLPVFKNMILRKPQSEIWNDLFTKNIELPDQGETGFLDYLESKVWPIPYEELVYNLFLLQMRINIFPEDLKQIAYYKGRKLGVLEVKVKSIDLSDEEKYRNEVYFLIEKGFVYSFTLISDRHRIEAESFRKRFINNIRFQESNIESAIPISAKYKQLEHFNQVDQEGMTYLLASFTHIINDEDRAKNYLRRMIQFLERGNRNLQHLQPLYTYSYNRFGSSFSRFKDKLKEKSGEKIDRVLGEALDKELDEAKKKELNANDQFVNDEAKIKFYLDEAKESGQNTDEKERKLIVD